MGGYPGSNQPVGLNSGASAHNPGRRWNENTGQYETIPSQDVAYNVAGNWTSDPANPGMLQRWNENTGQYDTRPAGGQQAGVGNFEQNQMRQWQNNPSSPFFTPNASGTGGSWGQQPQVHGQGRVTWNPQTGQYQTTQAPGVQYSQQSPWQQSMPSWATTSPYGYNPYSYSSGLSPYMYANATQPSMYQQSPQYYPYASQSYNPYSFGQQLGGWNAPIQNPAAQLTALQYLNNPVQSPIGQVPQSVANMMNPNLQPQNQMTPGGDSSGGSPDGDAGGVTGGLGAMAGSTSQNSAVNTALTAAGFSPNQSLFGQNVPSFANPTYGTLANQGFQMALGPFGMLGNALNYGYGLATTLNNPSAMGPAFSVGGVPGYSFAPNQSFFSMSPTIDMTGPATAEQAAQAAAYGLSPEESTFTTSVPTGSMIGNATGTMGFSPANTATAPNLSVSPNDPNDTGPNASAAAAAAAAAAAEADPDGTGASGNAPSGGPGGSECFPGTMMVRMADQSLLPIKDVKAGDSVISIDWNTGKEVNAAVSEVVQYKRPFRKTMLLLNNLLVTSPHRFAVGHDEWKEAGDLRVGDSVVTRDGTTKVTRTLGIPSTVPVYNLHVPSTLNFFVTDGGKLNYLVHNGK